MLTHDYKKFNLGLGNIMSCFAGSLQSGPDLTLNGPLLGQSPTVASICFLSGSFLPPCTCLLLCPIASTCWWLFPSATRTQQPSSPNCLWFHCPVLCSSQYLMLCKIALFIYLYVHLLSLFPSRIYTPQEQ